LNERYRLRIPFPQSGLVMVGLVLLLVFIHSLVPALALPAGGPFPRGSFQIQGTVDGTCVGLVRASAAGDPYRIAPLAMFECRVVPEQTWRYDPGQHHLALASRQAGPCAQHLIHTIEVAQCSSRGSGRGWIDQQWALTGDGAITGGDLPSWGELVTAIPQRGCWQLIYPGIDLTPCSGIPEQQWRAVPVSP
jgi:hypothetical protein